MCVVMESEYGMILQAGSVSYIQKGEIDNEDNDEVLLLCSNIVWLQFDRQDSHVSDMTKLFYLWKTIGH